MLHRILLAGQGIQAQVAENGKVAVDILWSEQNFDLILIDKDMPVMRDEVYIYINMHAHSSLIHQWRKLCLSFCLLILITLYLFNDRQRKSFTNPSNDRQRKSFKSIN
jgi:hypothetical protein